MLVQYMLRNPNFKEATGVYKIYCLMNGKNEEVRFINVTTKRIYDEWNMHFKSCMIKKYPIIDQNIFDWWHEVRAATGDHLFIKQLAEATDAEDAEQQLQKIKKLYRMEGAMLIEPGTPGKTTKPLNVFESMTRLEKLQNLKLSDDILRLIKDQKELGLHQLKVERMISKKHNQYQVIKMIQSLMQDGFIKKIGLMKNGRLHYALFHKDHIPKLNK